MKLDNGRIMESPKQIHEATVGYFEVTLTSNSSLEDFRFDSLINPVVSQVENYIYAGRHLWKN